MAGGRPMTNRSNFWSDDHRNVLFCMAGRANRWLVKHDYHSLDLWDLIGEGWYATVRRCRDSHGLRMAMTHTVQRMIRYGVDSQVSRFHESVQLRDIQNPFDQVDARDSLTRVLLFIHRDREFVAAAMMDGKSLSRNEAAPFMGVSGERVRQLRSRYLRQARRILGVA